MKMILPNPVSKFLMGMIALLSAGTAAAEWVQVLDYPSTQAVFVTTQGTVVAANYLDNLSGGILYSTDHGETWCETDADDYNYNSFVEGNGAIYALGMGCTLAKSTDDAQTWSYVSYAEAAEPYAPKGGTENCACYGAAFVGERLYVADLYCGVVYSDDCGDTWAMTDHDSMTLTDGYGTFLENVYGLTTIDDTLYALGLYYVYSYDSEQDKWQPVRSSNCMATHTQYQGYTIFGRAIANDDINADFLLGTKNGSDWGVLARPEGMVDNYVRALSADDDNLYVGMLNSGVLFTSDMGQTWSDISEGLPRLNANSYYWLIGLANDAEYLYAAIYHHQPSDLMSGIYRLAKADLPSQNSIAAIGADAPEAIKISGRILMLPQGTVSARIVDANGRTVFSSTSTRIDLASLASGIYLCVAMREDGTMTASKFANR